MLLADHAATMDDEGLKRFLTNEAGIDLGDRVTVVRRDRHVFVNWGFETK